MSDPVTNAEVEDVLSSIRRLVSEEKRPLQSAKPAPQNDRLVLTPALRVAEAAPEESAGIEPKVEAEPATEVAHQYEARSPGAEAIAVDLDDPYDNPTDELVQAALAADVRDVADQQPENDYAADPYGFDNDADVDGERAAPLALTVDSLAEPDLPQTDALIGATLPDAMEAAERKADTLSAKIEALEVAMGDIEDDFEPDEPTSDAFSGAQSSAMTWEDEPDTGAVDDLAARLVQDSVDDAENTAKTAPEPAPVQAAEPDAEYEEAAFSFAGDDQLIDEEALRDLVSDIVRAELQGALGERITRNVRKLVRREIHRALTTQDLE